MRTEGEQRQMKVGEVLSWSPVSAGPNTGERILLLSMYGAPAAAKLIIPARAMHQSVQRPCLNGAAVGSVWGLQREPRAKTEHQGVRHQDLDALPGSSQNLDGGARAREKNAHVPRMDSVCQGVPGEKVLRAVVIYPGACPGYKNIITRGKPRRWLSLSGSRGTPPMGEKEAEAKHWRASCRRRLVLGGVAELVGPGPSSLPSV